MRFDVITLFPEMMAPLMTCGITGRAVGAGLVRVQTWNPRDYTVDRHRTVDDRPYGGGPGMVMRYAPLCEAIHAAREATQGQSRVACLSPQGRPLTQSVLSELAGRPGLILVCGRYEGIDERAITVAVDEEWSIGDYVLSGGELAAMVLIDGVTRLLPGALGHVDSAVQDSFVQGLLDCPHYTRPETIDDLAVPPVLLSGDHAAIARWREKQALGRTWLRRPDLLETVALNDDQCALLAEFIHEYETD